MGCVIGIGSPGAQKGYPYFFQGSPLGGVKPVDQGHLSGPGICKYFRKQLCRQRRRNPPVFGFRKKIMEMDAFSFQIFYRDAVPVLVFGNSDHGTVSFLKKIQAGCVNGVDFAAGIGNVCHGLFLL